VVETVDVPIESISVARVLTRHTVEIHENKPVGKSVLSTSCTQLNVHSPDLKSSKWLDSTQELRYPTDSIIANFSEKELTLPKGTILGKHK
jgi:hypothetical protein